MHSALIGLLAISTLAGAPASEGPRPAPVKTLKVEVPQIPWWNSSEKARIAALLPCRLDSRTAEVKPIPLLLPYPHLAPKPAQASFYFQ